MISKDFYSQLKELNLNELLSFIAEGLIIFDADGLITIINPHASLLLDYTTDELVGKHVDDIIHFYCGERQIKGRMAIGDRVTRGEIVTAPPDEIAYFENKHGEKFPVFLSAKPMHLSADKSKAKGGALVFRDITTEKELAAYKETTAKTLSELTPVLQKTSTGDFTCYPSLPDNEDEFTELMVGLRLMLDDLQELDKAREENEKEKMKALEEKRELTEKYSKQLENEVEEKTEELSGAKVHIEGIIENLTTGLVECDSEGNVLRINKAAEDILGVSRDRVLGRQVTPEDIKVVELNSIARVMYPDETKDARPVSPEVSGIDAEVVELSIYLPIERNLQLSIVRVKPEDDQNEVTLRMIRDVTRERLISKSKSEFISIAAHQLRTPLSAIKWSLHLLLSGDFGKLEETQAKVLGEAFHTNEMMVGLVNDLLNVARIEDGRFGYEFLEGDYRQLIVERVESAQPRAEKKQIILVFNDASGGLPNFTFDQNKLGVAIDNIIDNAIKYTPEGGKVDVTLTKSSDYANLEVRDTGVGVPKNQMDRLFTKFFRAENVTTLPVAGSGLGLFITRNIVQRHGGDVSVMSREGEGTTIFLKVPTKEDLIPAKGEVSASLYE